MAEELHVEVVLHCERSPCVRLYSKCFPEIDFRAERCAEEGRRQPKMTKVKIELHLNARRLVSHLFLMQNHVPMEIG